MFKLFTCAVCQVEMKPGDGISIHAGPSNTKKLRPWDGPFLCASCQEKKEAMEGRRPGVFLSVCVFVCVGVYKLQGCCYKPYSLCLLRCFQILDTVVGVTRQLDYICITRRTNKCTELICKWRGRKDYDSTNSFQVPHMEFNMNTFF